MVFHRNISDRFLSIAVGSVGGSRQRGLLRLNASRPIKIRCSDPRWKSNYFLWYLSHRNEQVWWFNSERFQNFNGRTLNTDTFVYLQDLSREVRLSSYRFLRHRLDFLSEGGILRVFEGGLAYLEVSFEKEEGIWLHGRVSHAYNGGVSDIDSEENIDLRYNFDSFGQRKRQPSPFELHAFLLHFKIRQIKHRIVLPMSPLYFPLQLPNIAVIRESSYGQTRR